METINKLLIAALVIVSIAASGTVAYIIALFLSNKDITATYPPEPPVQPHPYNECMKLYIDQANKEGSKCDFDKAKAICFDLVHKDQKDLSK